jgi:hypothetical protein
MSDQRFLKFGENERDKMGTVKLSLGPISEAHIVEMASISREYHPNMLFGVSSDQRAVFFRICSSMWISGLLDHALRYLGWPERVLSVNIRRYQTAISARPLCLELMAQSLDPMTNRARLEFIVTQGDAGVVASGVIIAAISS